VSTAHASKSRNLLSHCEKGTEHFFLGLSLNLEAEEKMWWGLGRV